MGIGGRSRGGRVSSAGRLIGAALLALAPLAGFAHPVAAAGGVTLDAHAQLGGHTRPGAWAEIDVLATNDGPDVSGELRVRTQAQGASQFGVETELASGARKEFWLYAQPPLFATKLYVDLIVGGQTIATKDVALTSHDAYTPIVGVVAEHPEGFLRDVTDATAPNPQFGGQATSVITLKPADLPRRVEAWSAIDRLVWQDVDSTALSTEQIQAMTLWVAAGGHLVILGGSTGITTLSALPKELLPFVPDQTINVPTSDLGQFLGTLPDGAKDAPAIAGTLDHGTALGRSGESTYAASAPYGQGEVAIIGLNPAETWLTRSTAADTLWHRVLPNSTQPTISPFQLGDDSSLLYALQNLPSVALPPIENLFVLLFGYIVLIGPINYLVLRRLDKREWAWVTMPALVVVFAAGSYAMGATLKGSDVIVNEVSIVRAGQGTDQGRAQAYIGVYSPNRRTFDVQVANGALISNTTSQIQNGQVDQPLDVLIGQTTSQLRNFEVGFGVLRGFRAEAPAAAPKIDANLTLKSGSVTGTITNNSRMPLENVAVVFAGSVAVKPTLAPGEAWQVTLDADANSFQFQLSDRIFGSAFPSDPVEQRKIQTRRSVIDALTQTSAKIGGTETDVPMLMGWDATAALNVDLPGENPTRVGDSLFLVPLGMTYDPQAVFNDGLMVKTIVDSKSDQAWFDGNQFNLGRGTMTVELRPSGLSRPFAVTSLELALNQGNIFNLSGRGTAATPFPDNQQPDQTDPVGAGVDDSGGGFVGKPGIGNPGGVIIVPPVAPATAPAPATPIAPSTDQPGPSGAPTSTDEPLPPEPGFFDSIPQLQLFDFTNSRWYEFPHFDMNSSYVIGDPQRFVDASTGRVLARLVNRSNSGNTDYFQILARLEGTIQ